MNFAKGLMIGLIGLGIGVSSCQKEGCTDPTASNYTKRANQDDGSCVYDGDTPPGSVLVVTEDVTAPTTWNASLIEVCGQIDINAALTIPAGATVVMCADAGLNVQESGSITAIGTATSPIEFKGETSSPGYWRGIGIWSNNPNNQMEYVTVADAGSYWFTDNSNIYIGDLAKLTIKNSVISGSEKYGIYAQNNASFVAFSNNTFSNNTLAGLNISAKQVGSLDVASNYNNGNGEDFIAVRAENISSNATWLATSTPYLIIGEVDVIAGLTISSGTTIMFEANGGLVVTETGYLTALGTSLAPINFKGRFSSPGYWKAIDIESNNPNNKFDYVNVQDGGQYWFYDYASVDVDGRLEMNNSSISNSNSWAMVIGASGSVWCSGASQTDAAGITAVNALGGNGLGPDADCVGGGCTVLFE